MNLQTDHWVGLLPSSISKLCQHWLEMGTTIPDLSSQVLFFMSLSLTDEINEVFNDQSAKSSQDLFSNEPYHNQKYKTIDLLFFCTFPLISATK